MLLTLPVPQPCKEQVEAVADLLEGTLNRVVGRNCLFVDHDGEGSHTPIRIFQQVETVLNRGQSVLSDHCSLPRSLASICHDAGVQLHIVYGSYAECGDELISFGNEVVDHSLEHRDARENEMALGRVPDRPGTVKIEGRYTEIEGSGGKHSWGGTWPPQTVNTTAFPTVDALSPHW